ncbi:hypothetical protein yc1106_01332 [Curvularia clavata]|uniref:NACHT domain-containing protein n=1 Tax=Curvularia clavata TaxID=95742 RepID=A0A9Q8Z516_CURCL|nr:hypothetical protein yc1106_01332 [Curvularia clavata]
MEALVAIGLASNIVQFADCGIRWVSSAIELYKSGNGALQENGELQKVINSLRSVVLGLKTENRLQGDKTLDALVAACLPLADELTVILSKLKIDGQNRNRQEIIRKALQSLLKKEHIQDIERRLERIRDQICVHVNFLLVSQQFVLIPSLRELTDVQKCVAADTQADLSSIRSRLEDMSLKLQKISSWPQEFATEFPNLLQTFCEETRNFNKLRRILKSLYFEQLQMRQSQVKQAHKNTLEWIFTKNSNVNLCSWLRSGGEIYWISGKAGSGKSTLMKFLEEHESTHKLLKKWAGSQDIVIASHYFWSAGTPMQKSQGGLFRTLLSQILISCPEVAPLICGERWEDNSLDSLKDWTHKELCEAFQGLSSLQKLPIRFCFLIDGLDEYDGDHHELAELLVGISCSSNIKICASSRPWNDFIDAFGQSQWKLFIHELTKDDIRLYTEDNLEQNRRFLQLKGREPVAAESLIQKMSERSQGVFLWVYLVIRSLLRGLANRDEIRDLQRRLDELPSDLEEYFELMMSRIENVYRTRTARIFRTLIEAQGSLPLIALHFLEMEQDDPDYVIGKKIVPLSEDQLNEILEDKRWQLNAQCKDLLEVVQAPEEEPILGERFGFLHRTVIDF